MTLFIISLLLLTVGTVNTLILPKSSFAVKVAFLSIISGCLIALIPAADVLLTSETLNFVLPFNSLYGTFSLAIDALSAYFLLGILIVSLFGTIYGYEYMKNQPDSESTWFFLGLLVASMMGVVTARNGLLFLIFWEIMSLSSFLLVGFENKKQEVRTASLIYLVAAHIGAAFLILFFALLWVKTGSLNFIDIKNLSASTSYIDLLFCLAVIGFGAKAGFIVLHVWLPEAHPAAPSHISAIMSGVMVKIGIYGILRVLMLLGVVHTWWGWMLIIIGAASGIFGVLFTLVQRDLKKLLAYSTVENIGIITMGIGMGILGISYNIQPLIIMGFGGSLLHIINHSLFKSLLFLAAGSVLHGTGTKDIEQLGGLFKKMPWTGTGFLVGSVAISGLPPLNGFISEYLIYLGAFHALTGEGRILTVLSVIIIISLAIIGGMVLLSFTRAFGITFLGRLRNDKIEHIHESGYLMRFSMMAMAAGCFMTSILSPYILQGLFPVIKLIAHPIIIDTKLFLSLKQLISNLVIIFICFSLVIAFTSLIFYKLRNTRNSRQTETWGCGYPQITPRMQYTALSFSKPVTDLFTILLPVKRKHDKVSGLFPESSSVTTSTPDVFYSSFLRPFFALIEKVLFRFKWIQHGNLQLYVLYITATLIGLLIWKVS